MASGNLVTGQIGNGLDFNGVLTTGNNIDFGLNFPGNLPNGTVEMWFNPDDVTTDFTTNRYLFSRVISGALDGEWRLFVDSSGAEIGRITFQIECVPTQNVAIRSNVAVTNG
jgi:hypothetical protein